jgi:hypothetical protein
MTDACFDGVTVCADPGQYLFWDDIHPTAAAGVFLGEKFAAAPVREGQHSPRDNPVSTLCSRPIAKRWRESAGSVPRSDIDSPRQTQ